MMPSLSVAPEHDGRRGGGSPDGLRNRAVIGSRLRAHDGAALDENAQGAGADSKEVQAPGALASPALDRQVVRKATIDLRTPDVSAVFLKASLVLSEAQGEYIESSSLSGEGRSASANLTLRVQATRLSDVPNQLRKLGTVGMESSTGEDVTDRVVDNQVTNLRKKIEPTPARLAGTVHPK